MTMKDLKFSAPLGMGFGASFLAAGLAGAATLSVSTTAPTSVFASGAIDAPSFTRVFADGARPTDFNEGRGNEIIADAGSLTDYTMGSLVVRKDGAQDFTGSTATLTLYVFEGTKEEWDAGNGQSATDTDLFDGTVIATIYTETFPLNDNYAEGDYISLTLDTPIALTANMGFFLKMTQGSSSQTYFQIAQKNSDIPLSNQDGWQYQAPSSGNLFTGSPLEYYAVAIPEPSAAALLLMSGAGLMIRRRRR